MKLSLVQFFDDGRFFYSLATPIAYTKDGVPCIWQESGVEETEFRNIYGSDVEVLGEFDTFDKTFTLTKNVEG